MNGAKRRIDLNCDVGEGKDETALRREESIIPLVTSVNIACGWHAGSADTMRRIVRCATRHRIAVGAHPGFRDPEGYGRRTMAVTREEVENLIVYQVAALAGIAALEGVELRHVKPHGALYNQAAGDPVIAAAIADAVKAFAPALRVVGLAGSALICAARKKGLAVTEEAFLDRRYRADGTLVPRTDPEAVLLEEAKIVDQLRRLIGAGLVECEDGREIRINAQTFCLHADTPEADRTITFIRAE